jgi:hypothetical protein
MGGAGPGHQPPRGEDNSHGPAGAGGCYPPASPGRARSRRGRRRGHGRLSVHLHDEGPAQGLPQRQGGAQGHLSVVLPGREDRRARLERRRQVDAAEDHGRRRQGVHRRGLGRRGRERRLPPAGARPRPDQGRQGQHRGGRPRHEERAGPLRGGQHEARRADERRRDEPPPRRAGRAAGQDRRRQRLGARPHARDRDGRAALPAGRRRRVDAERRRAPPGRAVPAAAAAPGHAAARRADQPPRRGERRVARAPPAGVPGHGGGDHPRPLLPRQRRRLDPRARQGAGDPVEGQLLVVARPEAQAARAGGEGREQPPAHSRARVGGVADFAARGRPRARPASRPTRSCWRSRATRRRTPPTS